MALDSNILAMTANPPKPPDPLEQYGRVLALKNALGQGQLQQGQQQLQQQEIQKNQMELQGQKVLDHVMQTAFTKDADGNLTVNRDAVTSGLSAAGQGHRIPGVLKGFNELDEAAAKLKKTQIEGKTAADDYTAQGLLTIADHKFDPSIALGVLAHASESGVLPAEQARQMAGQISANPSPQVVQGLIEPLLSKSPAYQKLADSRQTAAGSRDRGEAALSGAALAKKKLQTETDSRLLNAAGAAQSQQELDSLRSRAMAGGASVEAISSIPQTFSPAAMQGFSRSLMSAEQRTQADQAAANAGETKRYHDAELENSAKRLGIERQRLFADTEETKLTPQARDKMAEMFATTGQLPTMGNGRTAAAVRSQVINRAADLFPEVQFAGNKAAFQANSASLKRAQTQLDSVDAAENTAGKNLQVFLDSAQKVIDLGSPFLNQPLRSIDQQALGSPEMAAVKAARTTALTEISKVLNNPNGSAAVSDSARHEVEGLIGPDATMKQIYAAAKILRTDMRNRHEAYQQQVDAIGKRIAPGPSEQGKATDTPKASKRYNPKTGMIEDVN